MAEQSLEPPRPIHRAIAHASSMAVSLAETRTPSKEEQFANEARRFINGTLKASRRSLGIGSEADNRIEDALREGSMSRGEALVYAEVVRTHGEAGAAEIVNKFRDEVAYGVNFYEKKGPGDEVTFLDGNGIIQKLGRTFEYSDPNKPEAKVACKVGYLTTDVGIDGDGNIVLGSTGEVIPRALIARAAHTDRSSLAYDRTLAELRDVLPARNLFYRVTFAVPSFPNIDEARIALKDGETVNRPVEERATSRVIDEDNDEY